MYFVCTECVQDELTITRPLAPEEEVNQPSFLRSHVTRSSIYKKAFPKNGMWQYVSSDAFYLVHISINLRLCILVGMFSERRKAFSLESSY